MALEKLSSNKAFGGEIRKYKLQSKSLSLPTQFNVFLPESSLSGSSEKAPVLYYLAGLTCNEDTGPWKGGIIAAASKQGLAVVFPDTSPRGAEIEGEDKDWDFGTGAGFYLNATSDKYKKNYRMYDLITKEIPAAITEEGLPVDGSRTSVFGHSMGGHGALTIYLKSDEGAFKSCSAFSPIANPTNCPWGDKAFAGYLASPETEGPEHDASLLLSKTKVADPKILVDYGTGDNFYQQGQLKPEVFDKAAKDNGCKNIEVRSQEGYDHSYYFISTFIEEHVAFHAKHLKA